MKYIIGVDTGGTFTDAVAIDDSGQVVTGKAPTTPDRLVEGVLQSVEDAAAQLDVSADDMLRQTTVFRFSGTTAINALITRAGAKTGLITTRGFEDTIEIGRGVSAWAGLNIEEIRHAYKQRKPDPLVPKPLIRSINERVDEGGNEVVPLDVEGVRDAARSLMDDGVESIAVCFLWAVRNGDHERRAREAIVEMYPDLYVCTSHEVASYLGEYERFITAVVNAYVAPRLSDSLAELERILQGRGFGGELLVGQSDGGALYTGEAIPAYTLQSGPAAGVIASKGEGDLLDFDNIITADVGGTSFDVGLVADGAWIVAREPVVARYHVGFPMIDVESVGAGGGSIAWIDEGGALNVGPQSAGASPGPASYGLGGESPTVTDAAVVLGYLNPDYFLGGKTRLRADLARQAIEKLADRLGMDTPRAAAGIFAIANAHMSALVSGRVVSHGYDPRDFILFAYGGAGAMHSAFYAAEMGVREVVVPGLAGTFSALGVATAPLLHGARFHDFAPMPMPADRFNENLERLEREVAENLDRDQVPEERRDIVYGLEMRYGVQVNTVRVPIARKTYDDAGIEEINTLFDELYEQLYGRGSAFTDAGRFVTSFVVEGYGILPTPERARDERTGTDASDARVGLREAYFSGSYVPTDVYRLDRLSPGNAVRGPAIVEAAHTTVVVPPEYEARLDHYRNVHVTTEGAASPMEQLVQ